jgi:CheY-like chemotaxis protein
VPAAITSAWRVLLVDDDPLVRESIRQLLEFDQHKVATAANAADALTLTEKETFDVVILDYLMPGMKGDQLAVVLRQRFSDLPVIMITAAAEKVDSSSTAPPGVDVLIAKPFQLEDLRGAVSKLMK